ncbi:MAG TPA: hypothetical protein VMQ65_06195 [Candidatus Limnocylindria bacterium]|nr:hypothetical protein [Candidatus Limnocylindria bacterium]
MCQEGDVAAQAVVEAAEDGQRPDAKHDARRDERLGHARRPIVASEAALEPGAHGFQPIVQPEPLADGDAEEDAAEDGQRVPGPGGRLGEDLEAHRHREHEREQA